MMVSNENNTLNALIFRCLSIYLIYNNNNNNLSFKKVLELSLISKSTFKTIQNLIISHPINKQLFIIPTITTFIKYILNNNKNNNYDNDSSYKYKLIQYKDIDEITFFNITDEIFEKGQLYSKLVSKNAIINGGNDNDKLSYIELQEKRKKENHNDDKDHDYENDDDDTDLDDKEFEEEQENLYFQLSRIKSILNYKCPLLKKLVIAGSMDAIEMIQFDFTFGGFYQVNKLHTFFSICDPPTSTLREISPDIDYDEFDFSFNFIKLYKPIKLEISTLDDCNHLILSNCTFDNILKNGSNSIQSISFSSYPIKKYEIEKIISSNSPIIKSLKIEIPIPSVYYKTNSISFLISALENSNFTTTNTTLKKLIISYYGDIKCYSDLNLNRKLFDLLKLNKSLSTLGLDYFSISDHKQLLPLKEIKNITTLYTNSFGLETILKHCNENKNIKELHYIGINRDTSYELEEDIQIFTDFLKSNQSSLNAIILKSYNPSSSIKLKEFLDKQYNDGKDNFKNYPNIIISQKHILENTDNYDNDRPIEKESNERNKRIKL